MFVLMSFPAYFLYFEVSFTVKGSR